MIFNMTGGSGGATSPDKYLVKEGVLVGSYEKLTFTDFTTQYEGYVRFSGTSDTVRMFTMWEPVDLTNINEIRLVLVGSSNHTQYYRNGVQPAIVIGTSRPTCTTPSQSSTAINIDYYTMLKNSSGSITAGTYTLNVSALTGNYYLGFAFSGNSALNGIFDVYEFGAFV